MRKSIQREALVVLEIVDEALVSQRVAGICLQDGLGRETLLKVVLQY